VDVFTGIVQEVGSIISVTEGKLTVGAGEVLKEMQLGGSVAVNGACLTMTAFDVRSFTVDVMPETRRRTNLGRLRAGDRVNLERPMSLGGEMGGHLVQGHIDDVGRVASVTPEGGVLLMKFEAPPEVMRYIVPKGFIAVDGASLTVTGREAGAFSVSLVGYTRQNTVLGERRAGDAVNLEVDIIAKYVEQLGRPQGAGLTADFLREHGFAVS
jgi:riboflavin synthase